MFSPNGHHFISFSVALSFSNADAEQRQAPSVSDHESNKSTPVPEQVDRAIVLLSMVMMLVEFGSPHFQGRWIAHLPTARNLAVRSIEDHPQPPISASKQPGKCEGELARPALVDSGAILLSWCAI